MCQKKKADPQALGLQYQLDHYRASYKPSVVGVVVLYVVYLFFFLFGPSLIGTIVIVGNIFAHGEIFSASEDLPFLLFGLFWSGLLLWALIWVYLYSRLRVHVYDLGLIYWQGRSPQPVYWQDVLEVRHKVRTYRGGGALLWLRWTSHVYTLSCASSKPHKLRWIFMTQELGRSIEEGTSRYLFPTALNIYQMHYAVIFGPLIVTPQGLYYGPDLLPWNNVASIRIGSRLVIRQQGKRKWFRWASVKLAEVPNIEVFRTLVPHITGGLVIVSTAWKNGKS